VSRTLRLADGAGTEASRAGRDPDLARLLPEGTAAPDGIPGPVFDAALRRIRDLQRLDMRGLAAELGVGRATLYRWVGSRDALLGELFWWLARRSHARALDASAGQIGRDRILGFLQVFLDSARRDPALRRFLAEEPEVALRVLTSRAARVQSGSIALMEALLAAETGGGRLHPAVERSTLAYVIVRICESFLYADVIAGREVDLDQARTVVGHLLGP
jgi:AcrR family transcriptional regulator